MSTLAIIPARGGSKGVSRKNLRPLAGKPLIAHSIMDAKEAKLVNSVYVSTDDPEIAEISRLYGAEVIDRPAELAGDTASSESALLHVLTELEKTGISPELVIFLQCTSPIRTGADIDQAIEQLILENADSLLSVCPSHKFLWEQVNGLAQSINYDYRQRPRRQDMLPQFVENGSLYIFKPWVLKSLGNRLGGQISLFSMSEEASWDIDSMVDFEIAEFLLSKVEKFYYP
ncbi:acylneuraminate cytidylyltransferase family protein [Microcoleus sp. FACHB-68]|uniref:acylneuraminate cytidylyltransferase family protein n=1 Tax=Microcoleus sp. FACHB-68 TaxID=2692826 RepID=UPI0016835425|nr:acylneuraminate cytidylyltransferase family protein [Microcoleus sp. FACHB-68]MBD1936514.1 acylneuraminate cytidylyltransferase family protein [Microcoleus sp. FACHB-68]